MGNNNASVKKVNCKNVVIAAAIIMVLAIGCMAAFFTDADDATNVFTVGNVSIDLTEPNWDTANSQHITPNKTIAKDPQVTNDGANDAFCFIEVEVPRANIKTANSDGSVNAAAVQDLFTYKVNSDWALIKTATTTTKSTYTYAYVGTNGNMKALTPGRTTTPVFNSVTFVNAIEGQLDNSVQTIAVSAMAIQTNDLGDNDTTVPTEVYSIVTTQNK